MTTRLQAFAAFAAAFLLGPDAAAQQATEAAIKAAYLYKFAAYVEWPAAAFATPETPLTIATEAADDVATELDTSVAGRTVNNRRVVVRRLREGEAPRGVHLLFIGRRDPNPRAAVRAAHQLGVLTVTEAGLDLGGAINLVVADDRVTFEVSLDAAERSGHKISSRMLAVARRVVPRSPS